MSMTYHHYGAAVLNAPIAQLRRDMPAILNVPPDLVRAAGRTAAGASARRQPCLQLAIQIGDTAVLEEAIDRVAGTHTLTYHSTACAPEIADYVATCTLQSVAHAPHTTFVEWTHEYRPAAPADVERIRPFARTLVDQDQALASWLAAEYGSTEVLYLDYTLGGV
jgi:hypothetical protein